MAIARLSTGEIYTTYEEINKIVKPMQVGGFNLAEEVSASVSELPMPVQQEGAEYLLKALDQEAVAMTEREGFVYRRVGCYVPPEETGGICYFSTRHESDPGLEEEMSESDLKAYLTPHHVLASDLHFVFSGLITKGLLLEDGRQAVVYAQAGDWIRLNQTILNWPIFPSDGPVVAISYFDRSPNPETNDYDMDLHPEVEVLPTMLF